MKLPRKPYLREISLRGDGTLSGEAYPFDIPAVRRLGKLCFHPDVTFFIGENGSGKSTLLEAIALALGFGAEGGTKNVRHQTVDTTSSLHASLDIARGAEAPRDHYFLRAESFYNIATYMDEVGLLGGYGGKSLHHQSHGEAFLALLTKKLRGNGLYLLDEPEAALSPNRQLAALVAINQLVDDQSQFVIVTHSPILLSYPRAKIMLLDETGIREVNYEDTEHFTVSRDFLNNYRRRLELLFDRDA